MLLIAPTVMLVKTTIFNPNSSASFNIRALDQQITYSHYYYTPQRITAEIEGISNCTTNNLIFYNIEIDLHNDGTIDMVASSDVDHDYLTWTKDSLDGKFKCFIAPNSKGNFTFTLPPFPFDYTPKSHKFYWHIYDECGQESKTTSLAYTVDKKAPTPYCVSISTGMMQSNPIMFEAIAIYFDKGAFDNFTPEDKLLFTFEGLYPLKEYINEEHYHKKGISSSVIATKDEYLKGKAYRWRECKILCVNSQGELGLGLRGEIAPAGAISPLSPNFFICLRCLP